LSFEGSSLYYLRIMNGGEKGSLGAPVKW